MQYLGCVNMNEEFKQITDNLYTNSNKPKSRLPQNDKNYTEKFDRAMKNLEIKGFDLNLLNFMYQYQNGGYGYYDNELITKFSKKLELERKHDSYNP